MTDVENTYEERKSNMEIIVVGPTQSGKTCLAVGLDRTYAAKPKGPYTQKYITDRKNEFTTGWPDPTKGEALTLDFDFRCKNEKDVPLSFIEYKGEESTENWLLTKLNDLGADDGAVILVNPSFKVQCVKKEDGTDRLATDSEVNAKEKPAGYFERSAFDESDIAERWLNDTEEIYQRLIENLEIKGGERKPDLPVVVVAVTASDRLDPDGDLHDKQPRFEKFLRKIEKMLRRFDSEVIYVSVTGHLDKQNEPKLADGEGNTSQGPFECLIQKLEKRGNIKKRDKWIKMLLCLVAAGACVAALCVCPYKWIAEGREALRWEGLKSQIDKKWREIADSQGERGSVQDIDEVNKLFSSFKPTVRDLADEYGKCQEEFLANVSFWRTRYETIAFSRKVNAAIKNDSLESLAKVYPGRVTTNEFLAAGFVEEQWEKRVKPVFEREYKAYLDGIAAKYSSGKHRSELSDDDRLEIERRASDIGEPFNAVEALAYVEARIKSKGQERNSAMRDVCEKWIREKIRPDRSRTGQNSLWDDYTREKKRHTDNPFFIEVVGKAVYREVEKWFESDVAAFKEALAPGSTNNVPLWLEHHDGDFKIRYKEIERRFNEFKKTCRHVYEDDKDPPEGTWVHRFAELCVVKGGFENGINKAFVQHIDARQLDAMIDYTINGKQNFPFNYKWTSFAAWFEVESFEGNGSPMTDKVNVALIDVDGHHAPKEEKTSIGKENEGKFKTIWSDKKMLEAGLFQRTRFVVRATDYNGNGIKKTGDFTNVVSFVDKRQVLELNGQLHIDRWTGVKDANIMAKLVVDMSGETPFSLLEQAKRETPNNARQNETRR